ncbi:MAG: Mrp/NBP35 family ATP-binding protein [Clostridiales bacterium]|nr:Mrp/NBP35 family ATP-binding protein [Clostridiales bacterium]
MDENCNNDCASCTANCDSRKEVPKPTRNTNNEGVKKLIAIVSGKGGVGKTLITSLLAVEAQKQGHKVAVMDADITGPSIPTAFGLHKQAIYTEEGIFPVRTEKEIDVMSINLLLEDTTAPVVWRGPVISGAINQFWSDVVWGNQDIMFIDMPPGTGDVPLTVFQSLPVDAIIVVTSPQELVSVVVEKAVNMAKLMNIPILGLIENMSYFECDCGKLHYIYGESTAPKIAKKYSLPLLARLPITAEYAQLSNEGKIEEADSSAFIPIIKML